MLGRRGLRFRLAHADGLPRRRHRDRRDRRGDPQRLLAHPALLAQTAAGSTTSPAAAILGLGASGPQVVEGWHGMPYSKPLTRTREAIEIIRAALRRENLEYDGKSFHLPLPEGEGTGLGKPLKMLTRPERSSVPIYIAALGRSRSRAPRSTPTAGCPSSTARRAPRRSGVTRSRPARRSAATISDPWRSPQAAWLRWART